MLPFKSFLLVESKMIDLKKALRALGYKEFKDLTKSRVAVLVNGSRIPHRDKILKSLEKSLGARLDMSKANISSIGLIDAPGFGSVVIKNSNRQGNKSAGIENEIYIINTINKALADGDGPMKVIFKAGRKTYVCDNVTNVKEMGRDTSGRKKADIILEGRKNYPISLKKDNAGAWESADKKYGAEAGKIVRELVKANKVTLTTIAGGYGRISPEIAVPISDRNANDVIFGSDLKPNGAVVVRTFGPNDFNIDFLKGTITITCSSIIRTLKDVKKTDKEPIIIIRNDKSRSSKAIGIPGLRVLVNQMSRVSSKSYKVTDRVL